MDSGRAFLRPDPDCEIDQRDWRQLARLPSLVWSFTVLRRGNRAYLRRQYNCLHDNPRSAESRKFTPPEGFNSSSATNTGIEEEQSQTSVKLQDFAMKTNGVPQKRSSTGSVPEMPPTQPSPVKVIWNSRGSLLSRVRGGRSRPAGQAAGRRGSEGVIGQTAREQSAQDDLSRLDRLPEDVEENVLILSQDSQSAPSSTVLTAMDEDFQENDEGGSSIDFRTAVHGSREASSSTGGAESSRCNDRQLRHSRRCRNGFPCEESVTPSTPSAPNAPERYDCSSSNYHPFGIPELLD